MPPRHARVLIDTNAIQAAHRSGCWNVLHKSYKLETAAFCLEEVIRPNRKGKKLVDRSLDELNKEVVAHEVTDAHRAVLLHALQGRVDLDDGERDLLAVALSFKTEVWWLCGPDKATLRALHLLGIIDRMCSLQGLAASAGMRLVELEEQYTEKWLSSKRTLLLLGRELI
ncbi:MAG: hypothetical protein HYY24_15050 [Verrucomicrobia bacterium]|nr:hypothetical protein [Verrucomicrobiota bacterium]